MGYAAYGFPAAGAWQALTGINRQPLIKSALFTGTVTVITQGRTAISDRFFEDLYNLTMDSPGPCQGDTACPFLGAYVAAKKDLTGIDITYTCYKGVIKQDILDVTGGFSKCFPHIRTIKLF